jgi:hypothetical protein
MGPGDRTSDFLQRVFGPWARKGFLYLPVRPRRYPVEMEYVKAYVTYSELHGERPSFDALVDRLGDIGLQSLMVSLSNLGQILHNDGAGKPEVQAALYNDFLTPGMLSRLRRVRHPDARLLFFPQQILYTAKLAILYSPNRGDPRPDPEFRDALVTILLMATEFLGGYAEPQSAVERDRFLLSYVIRDHSVHAQDQLRYMLPRSSLLFRKYPTTDAHLRQHPDYLDLDAVFKTATGFRLEDYISFGISICTWFITQSVLRQTYEPERQSINPKTFLATTRLDPKTAKQLYAELTHTYESALAAIKARGSDPAKSSYDFLPFLEKPLYEVREDVVVPFHLAYLEAKFSGGIYWRILDSLKGVDRLKFMRFFGAIYEHYVCESFERAIPDAPGLAKRLFREAAYSVKSGERKTPDLVICYERSAVFLEVKASRIRMEATALTRLALPNPGKGFFRSPGL